MNRRTIAMYNFWILVKEAGERANIPAMASFGKRRAYKSKG